MDIYTQILRLVVASLVGLIIGLERTKRRKAAGVGTFAIICITSCLLTLISAYGFSEITDPSRIIANIITAIGFVAGGVIFKDNSGEKVSVSGITTGAEIFCVSSLGIGIGLGMHYLVLTVMVLIEFNIYIANKLKKYYTEKYHRDDYPD